MDKYYVVRLLGKGSEGSVLFAQDKQSEDIFAIKRLEVDSMERANEVLNEGYKLLTLCNNTNGHPNIISYHHVFLHKYPTAHAMMVCIVMEYCSGGDFASFIRKHWKQFLEGSNTRNRRQQAIPERVVLECMLQICNGLNYLHENDLIHRDLKPSNVLIQEPFTVHEELLSSLNLNSTKKNKKSSGRHSFHTFFPTKEEKMLLKIADFGTLKQLSDEQSYARTFCGTANFMSPEALNGQPYNEKTDLFSLGQILLEMLTGKTIFLSVELQNKPNLFEELKTLIVDKYGYQESLFDLLKSLLSSNPNQRPSAAECIISIKKMIKKITIENQEQLDIAIQQHEGTITDQIDLKLIYNNILLNDNLKLIILKYFECFELYHLMLVNKHFNQFLCENKNCDKIIWKQICRRILGKQIQGYQTDKKANKSLPYRQYLKNYFDYQKQGLEKRKKLTLGKTFVHELLPNQISEAAHLLAKAYKDHPIFQYVFFGNIPQCIKTFNTNILSFNTQDMTTTVKKNVTNPTHMNFFTSASPSILDISPIHSDFFSPTVSPMPILLDEKDYESSIKELSEKEFDALETFMKIIVEDGCKYGRVWITEQYDRYDNSEVIAVSVWQNPYNNQLITNFKSKLQKSIAFNKYSVIWRKFGIKATRRLIKILEKQEDLFMKFSDKDNNGWVLFLLGIRKQDLHIGYYCLNPIFKQSQETSLSIYTFCCNPFELRFFFSNGFVIINNDDKDKGSNSLPLKVYFLKRTEDVYIHYN
ncbi:hypothetical protein ABK040_012153 [Willaertia magna]